MKIWEESIRVQMHFDAMIMRNRITFASIVFAAFGAAVAVQKLVEANEANRLSEVILIITAIGIVSYGVIDIGYYFRLLLGAVEFTEKMDKRFKGLGLTTSITNAVGHKQAKLTLWLYYLIIVVGFAVTFVLRSKI